MTDIKRTLLAGFLIAGLTLFIPFYLQFIGAPIDGLEEKSVGDVAQEVESLSLQKTTNSLEHGDSQTSFEYQNIKNNQGVVEFYVETDRFVAKLSNVGGGSLSSFSITDNQNKSYQYLGGYNQFGEYDGFGHVNLLNEDVGGCSPCLLSGDNKESYNLPFLVVDPVVSKGQTMSVSGEDSLVIYMSSPDLGVSKKTIFYGNRFVVVHDYSAPGLSGARVLWDGGIKMTEENLVEELTYSSAYIAQNKDIESVTLSPSSIDDVVNPLVVKGGVDWVALRNKYFINSLVADDAFSGEVSGVSVWLNSVDLAPKYSMSLDFSNTSSIVVKQFFGPLDIDVVGEAGTYLDRVMNFGWLPIQPFSRAVLWILKSLGLLGLNYGVVLILFAFLIRVLTGPLTKKSFESTQKMQKVQPKLKNIQKKYKNDPQRLNRETINLYKTEGVNPLGGCLPMLIQMPLLFSLFIVFRSTIEFRGAPFLFWIDNLSQPDKIFNLPFYIPLYGDYVGFLPIVLGVSMFLSQRLSMATMDDKQKPIMYMMSAFFFLIFNSFPSGLNLYYAVYNILNYFQQKQLKKA